MELKKRNEIKAQIVFDTAFHIGSGDEGEGASDMGVLTDPFGNPLIPGSSLKGVFRSTAEALAGHLGMTTCFLEKDHEWCAGANENLAKKKLELLSNTPSKEVDALLRKSVCDTCLLFGSVLAKGKVRFMDAPVLDWAEVLEIRDGVVIDRDSGTAVPQAKYDYEVVPANARFAFEVLCENLEPKETALVFAVLKEWSRRFHIGGMTSRGFGAARLDELEIKQVDFSDPEQRFEYLLNHTMNALDEDSIQAAVRNVLEETKHA